MEGGVRWGTDEEMDKLTEDIMVGTSMGKVDDKMMLGTSAYLNITSLCGKAGWQVLSYFLVLLSWLSCCWNFDVCFWRTRKTQQRNLLVLGCSLEVFHRMTFTCSVVGSRQERLWPLFRRHRPPPPRSNNSGRCVRLLSRLSGKPLLYRHDFHPCFLNNEDDSHPFIIPCGKFCWSLGEPVVSSDESSKVIFDI